MSPSQFLSLSFRCMASFNVMAFLAVLVVLLPTVAVGRFFDSLAPAPLASFYDNSCENVNCGKGKCNTNSTSPFAYVCECEPGWKRAKNDQLNDYFKFLPCLYPDCGNCEPTIPPLFPEIELPFNMSDFDPCSFTYCGEGTCKNTSMYQHKCDCNPGFRNLLNISYFPCYNESSLNFGCGSRGMIRGLTLQRDVQDEVSQATSFLPEKFPWMVILILSAAMAMWK